MPRIAPAPLAPTEVEIVSPTPDIPAGLRPLALQDLARYKAAIAAAQQSGWAYYFPYLLAKDKPGRGAVLVGDDEGPLCLYAWKARKRRPRLDLLFPPIPMESGALRQALERANDFNRRRTARVLRIDEQDVAAVSATEALEVKQRRAQYVFAPHDYENLGGRRLRTLRRHIGEFEGRSGIEIVPFLREHEPACRALLRRWRREHRAAHGTSGGAGGTARMLALAGTLSSRDLRGELVFLDGQLVAFAFGGEIRPGVGCFFDAKSDASVPGLSFAHRRHFLLTMHDFERVNDGSDAGRPGLRQLKASFRPIAMHHEYRASPVTP